MKNSNDTIGNRTRDLPVCSAVRYRVPPAMHGTNIKHEYANVLKKSYKILEYHTSLP
jgi:hypothetical protein